MISDIWYKLQFFNAFTYIITKNITKLQNITKLKINFVI